MAKPITEQGGQMGDMGKLYDKEAPVFAAKSKDLVWWTTLGISAYDGYPLK